MKRQIYKINKTDWIGTVRRGKRVQYAYGTKKKELLDLVYRNLIKGAEVQVFKLSYEFKDSFVVPK